MQSNLARGLGPFVLVVAASAIGWFLSWKGGYDGKSGNGTPAWQVEQRSVDAPIRLPILAPVHPGPASPPTVALPDGRKPNDGSLPAPPSPPSGYAFVAPAQAMAIGRLERRKASDRGSAATDAWLGSPGAAEALTAQAERMGRGWTYGWIRVAPGSSPAAAGRALAGLGAVVEGAAGRLLRARIPGGIDALGAIAALSEVDAIGAMPAARKVRESLAAKAATAPAGKPLPVFVTLMADDPDGRLGQELERRGATLGRFDAAIRAYAAEVDAAALDAVAAADFVQAVEPVREVRPMHDTAVPAMGADALRSHAGSGVYSGTGGSSVPIGVMDTGLNARHVDIESNRQSICGVNFVPDDLEGPFPPQDEDLWIDVDGHGTHVTGTIAGAGIGEARYAGMAPAVRHIRFAKVLHSLGFGTTTTILSGMDYLAEASACGGAAAKPLIVNMSLAACGRRWEGRTIGERKLDATVWGAHQLYVVANANSADSCFADLAGAKNALAVGAVRDDGLVASFSSHGPTADGRLAPQVSAAGVQLHSARGQGSRSGYDAFSGTSMASPAAAGVAALLMDAVPDHRNNPALARARLMASALRPDAWFDAGRAFPATNTDRPGAIHARYGLGKVSAHTAALQRNQPNGWAAGAAVATLTDGEYGAVAIEVPAGTARLDVVMTWDEPPSETIADPVLNDLDLWLDQGADCGAGACGEFSSRSEIDNVEWVIVHDPAPGTWRLKATAERVYTAPPRAAVAWTLIRGASTPQLAVDANAKPAGSGRTEIVAKVSTSGYVAAGIRLGLGCRAASGSDACGLVRVHSASLLRSDGMAVGLLDEISERGGPTGPGMAVPVGEVAAGAPRTVRLDVSHPADAGILLTVKANAWNALAAVAGVAVGDRQGAPQMPGAPPNDAFAKALALSGASGSETVDLLRATADPAEPAFGGADYYLAGAPPAGSVWFTWTAPSDGLACFAVEVAQHPYAHRLDVYRGDAIAALEAVASGVGDLCFLAKRGHIHRIRLSHNEAGRLATLRWRPGERPAHDDFAAAVELAGESGSHQASNAGATLEPGEWFGGTVATTWHRWTAPSDGWWEFSREGRANVAVFEGDGVQDARLVSGFSPGDSIASFPAAAGRTYRIMVGGEDAFGPAGAYTLGWQRLADGGNTHDEVGFAQELPKAASGTPRLLFLSGSPTVSPGEPLETGVRTAWWQWEAPSAGNYTWRADNDADALVSLFSGPAADQLALAAQIRPRTPARAAVVAAESGERFWVSVGFAPRGRAAFTRDEMAQPTLSWGPTPANDRRANAALLSGVQGSVSASNRYATTAPRSPRSELLGRSTLWWTYQAEQSGWVRFEVEGTGAQWAVAVHDADAVRAASRWQRTEGGTSSVLFYAEAGSRHTISVGVLGGAPGGDFELRWEAAEPPAWLRYAGRVADGHRDANGTAIEIRGPGELAFGGETLYLASRIGVQAFARDAASGALSQAQHLEGGLERASVVWDRRHGRLLAHDCGTWRSFAPTGDGPQLAPEAGFQVVDGTGGCGRLYAHPDGAFVYRGRDQTIDAFVVEADGGLRLASSREVGTFLGASPGEDGLLYVAGGGTLVVLRTDAATGELTSAATGAQLSGHLPDRVMLTQSADLLFAVDRDRTQVFTLADAQAPAQLAALPRTWPNPNGRTSADWCGLAAIRGASSADLFCGGQAFTVGYLPDRVALVETDRLHEGQGDRYDNLVPAFGRPTGLAASPDGRHLYLASASHGILVFERIVAPVGDTNGKAMPDLRVISMSVDEEDPAPGSDIALSATVRNAGTAESAPTTLRWYRSRDAAIAADDHEVGTASVGRLGAAASSTESVSTAVPSESGAYWYGACVDTVAEELRVLNNCSAGVGIGSEPADIGSEPADDHGDTFETATAVAIPSSTEGHLGSADDKDYFKMVLNAAAMLTLESAGEEADTLGTLFDASGTELDTDDDGGLGVNFKIQKEVQAGTYFVEVRAYSSFMLGDYLFNVDSAASGNAGSGSTEVPQRQRQ